ncbi:MAG: pentapeptide repeat-containing protein [Rhodobacteraceae bacterium]|nr:pentapeptide repeat-containing protein [Paracoccaceae bacterium]
MWCWLGMSGSAEQPSNGEKLRNLFLVLAAVIGLPLAWWRNRIANSQAETANRQAETAERGQRDGRYEKAVDMLGSAVLTTRMGGISALNRLAETHPEDYHVQVMEALCAFIRFPTKDKDLSEDRSKSLVPGNQQNDAEKATEDVKIRPDVEQAAQVIGERRTALRDKTRLEEIEAKYRPDLRGADLRGAFLVCADLGGANLNRADLTGAYLRYADLTGAYLIGAHLSRAILIGADLIDADLNRADFFHANLRGADLTGADLYRAKLHNTNLSDAYLHTVRNLTQAQLDRAVCFEGRPPKLDGGVQAKTSQSLVWDPGTGHGTWVDHEGNMIKA